MEKVNNHCLETGMSLRNLKPVILHRWEELVQDAIAGTKHEPEIILVDHMPEVLDNLIKILMNGSFLEFEPAKAHGFQRAVLTSFSIEDLLSEYTLLRSILMDYLYPMGDVECAKIVHKYIDDNCQNSVTEFIKNMSLKNVTGYEISNLKDSPSIKNQDAH